MRRREFLHVLGGAAIAWPLAARAQQLIPVVGFLNAQSPETFASFVAAFREGLAELGYVEGRNVAIEYRWARGQYDRLGPMATELVQRRVSVLVTTGGEPAAFACNIAANRLHRSRVPVPGRHSGRASMAPRGERGRRARARGARDIRRASLKAQRSGRSESLALCRT